MNGREKYRASGLTCPRSLILVSDVTLRVLTVTKELMDSVSGDLATQKIHLLSKALAGENGVSLAIVSNASTLL